MELDLIKYPSPKRQKLSPPPMQPLFPESSATPMESTASLTVQGKVAQVFEGDERFLNNSKVNSNGTFTPISSYEGSNDVTMSDATECPCGYLHGPGQGDHQDLQAVGFANIPLMRGPE
ncbi:uncharacterized protein KQ657_002846 [Scheffersomyces spartinae]|uniref:Uncharacterized protein n=1 Tax=Scheffersomyces spartinae TaxID=45513 RepID=A0A9P8AGR7_9ASCO|nr:uncharacterized protein KQ657_002846 [Scheffersomyces spartinae]KAG7191710.1 hypothetical protein KQ657_002846 [Scheffersomyces spartinae]